MPSVRFMIPRAKKFPSVVKLKMEGDPREIRYVRESTCRNSIKDEDEYIDGDFRCSECGVLVASGSHSEPIAIVNPDWDSFERWKFCPHCGAKVVE